MRQKLLILETGLKRKHCQLEYKAYINISEQLKFEDCIPLFKNEIKTYLIEKRFYSYEEYVFYYFEVTEKMLSWTH